MTHAALFSDMHYDPLVKLLAEYTAAKTTISPEQFTEKLGGLLSFADALNLSATLKRCETENVDIETHTAGDPQFEYNRVRKALHNHITKSFVPASDSRVKMPVPDLSVEFSLTTCFESYLRFYAFHQREMDSAIRSLRTKLRGLMSERTQNLSMLVQLDSCLDDIFLSHSRKLFASIPKLLEKRFELLFKAQLQREQDLQLPNDRQQWLKPGSWLYRFGQDLQALLYAELDLRLQPSRGLVDAFNKEVVISNE